MYGISLGTGECPVFYEDGRGQTFSFNRTETRSIIESLLDKKARGNGVGIHLFDTLRLSGFCRYDFPRRNGDLAFYCTSLRDGTYTIRLMGTYPNELIDRINRSSQQSHAINLTRRVRENRRHLRRRGLYKDPVRQRIRSLAGESGNLKLHFRHSSVTCSDAIAVIAHATSFDHHWVRNRLMRSLDDRSVASLRMKGGFVFRVDLASTWRGLLDLSTLVQIRTTNDNTHGAYRRLRNAMRKRLKLERKARIVAQQAYLESRKIEKITRRLFG